MIFIKQLSAGSGLFTLSYRYKGDYPLGFSIHNYPINSFFFDEHTFLEIQKIILGMLVISGLPLSI